MLDVLCYSNVHTHTKYLGLCPQENGCNNLLPNEPVQMQTSSTRGESVADVMVREPELHEPEPQTGNRGKMEANLDIIKSSSCYI